MLELDHGPVFAAYRTASAVASKRGLAADAWALADQVRRMTDAIAWAAEFRPDGEAITRRDIGALQLLAEWAALGVLLSDAIPAETFEDLYRPFARAVPSANLHPAR